MYCLCIEGTCRDAVNFDSTVMELTKNKIFIPAVLGMLSLFHSTVAENNKTASVNETCLLLNEVNPCDTQHKCNIVLAITMVEVESWKLVYP